MCKILYNIFLLRSGIGLLLLCIAPLTANAQFVPDSKVKATSSGKEKITLTERDWVVAELKYLEKKNNNWYERFWKEEGLTSPRDIYVSANSTNLNSDAIIVTYEVPDTMEVYDPGYEIHKRISRMLFAELSGYTSKTWIKWMAALKPGYEYGNPSANRVGIDLLIPEQGMDSIGIASDFGKTKRTVSAQEYLYRRIHLATEDLATVYQEFLDFSGLELGYDASLTIETDKQVFNLIVLKFTLTRKAVKADSNLEGHRNMSAAYLRFLERKLNGIRPDWLRLQAIADTSDSRRAPVILQRN